MTKVGQDELINEGHNSSYNPAILCENIITGTPLPLSFQVWINQGDIILIGLRDYQDAKADVILRYNPDEARNLKAYGELPETGESWISMWTGLPFYIKMERGVFL